MLVLSGSSPSGGCCGRGLGSSYDDCVAVRDKFGSDMDCEVLKTSTNPFVEWAAMQHQMYEVKAAEIMAASSTEADIKKTVAQADDPQAMAAALIAQGAPAELVYKALAEKRAQGSLLTSGIIALSLIAGGAAAYYGYNRSYGSVASAAGYGAAGAVMPILVKSMWRGMKA